MERDFLDKLAFSKDIERGERERSFVKYITKRVKQSETVIYLLTNSKTDEWYGFVALSATLLDKHPAIQIDYIFVNDKYSKVDMDILDGKRVSEYLLTFAIKKSYEISENIGVRYLILLPDEDILIEFYKQFGFKKFQNTVESWMFYKL